MQKKNLLSLVFVSLQAASLLAQSINSSQEDKRASAAENNFSENGTTSPLMMLGGEEEEHLGSSENRPSRDELANEEQQRLLTLEDFRTAAQAHPDATRLIINDEGIIVPQEAAPTATGKNRAQNIIITQTLRSMLESQHSADITEKVLPKNAFQFNQSDLSGDQLKNIFEQLDLIQACEEALAKTASSTEGDWFANYITLLSALNASRLANKAEEKARATDIKDTELFNAHWDDANIKTEQAKVAWSFPLEGHAEENQKEAVYQKSYHEANQRWLQSERASGTALASILAQGPLWSVEKTSEELEKLVNESHEKIKAATEAWKTMTGHLLNAKSENFYQNYFTEEKKDEWNSFLDNTKLHISLLQRVGQIITKRSEVINKYQKVQHEAASSAIQKKDSPEGTVMKPLLNELKLMASYKQSEQKEENFPALYKKGRKELSKQISLERKKILYAIYHPMSRLNLKNALDLNLPTSSNDGLENDLDK